MNIYKITMSDGYTIKVNASNPESAINSVLKAGIVNAPRSAFKRVELIKTI